MVRNKIPKVMIDLNGERILTSNSLLNSGYGFTGHSILHIPCHEKSSYDPVTRIRYWNSETLQLIVSLALDKVFISSSEFNSINAFIPNHILVVIVNDSISS